MCSQLLWSSMQPSSGLKFVMKESFFDCEKFIVDGKEIVIVPSINTVSEEDVKNAIESMIARYSQIGVDFSTII